MSHRDFLIPDFAIADGDEITVDHALLGHEQSCDLCGAVMFRSEPTGPHQRADVVNEARVNLTIRAALYVPGYNSYEVNIPVAVCKTCAPEALAPFAAAIKDIHPEAGILSQLLGETAESDEPTTTTAAAADLDIQNIAAAPTDADELAAV
jgi:hypothetical protein